MDFRTGIALLAVSLILAGCVATVGGEEQVTNRVDEHDNAAVAGLEAAGRDDGATTEPVIVAIETDEELPSATQYVRRAAAFWENDTGGSRLAIASDAPVGGDYPLGIGPGSEDADLVVRFADERLDCGERGPAHFCIDESSGDGPATATISPGLTEDGYTAATAAALGHLTGRDASAGGTLPEPAFADPWPARDTVTVHVENEVNPDRDFEPLVAETLRWWEQNDDRWGNYTTDWELVDDPDADVTVTFVDRVRRCGGHDDPASLLGCAPILHPGNLADDTERVRIKGGYTDETTLHILKHEFGHVYGRTHGSAPTEIMSARIPTRRLSEPDAAARDYAWESTDVPVHVDYDSFDAPRQAVSREVDRTLAYYERGAEGHLSRDVTFRRTRQPDAAVTIRSVDTLDCVDGPGSCGQRRGRNLDDDPALEVYSGLAIEVHDLDSEVLGWHTGRWLGYSLLGTDSAADLPPAFVPDDADHRRNWHERHG